jgi:CheY-like chemotaxis protein
MASSETEKSSTKPSPDFVAAAASELNNLLQIIAGSSSALEKVAQGDQQASQYLEMLRASIERAEMLGQEMAKQGGGAAEKTIRHSEISGFLKNKTSQKPSERHTILVVDDEKMALTLIGRILREAGYDVAVAQSGFECLDLFRRQPYQFSLVLLDLSLPFMDGEETFRRLREIRSDIPVILCTGFILQDRLAAMLESGLTGFVRKPVPPDELLSVVRSTFQSAMYSRDTTDASGMSLAG